MICLYTASRIGRESVELKDTLTFSVLCPQPYTHGDTHPRTCRTFTLNSSFAQSSGVLDLLSFIFVIKQNIILILDLPNLFAKSISVFTRYLVSSIILCFALLENMFNLPCPGPLWIMIQPFFFFYIKLIFFLYELPFQK